MLHMEALAKLRRSAPHLEFPALHKELFSVDGSWSEDLEKMDDVEEKENEQLENMEQDSANGVGSRIVTMAAVGKIL